MVVGNLNTKFSLHLVSVLFLAHLENISCAESNFLSYENARKAILDAEDLLATGGRLQLDEKESKVNDLFMQHKLLELSRGFRNTDINAASLHFFKGKPIIEESKIFRFLRQMPKGALLHVHNTASVSSEWIVRNISYMPGLLRCTNRDEVSILSFRRTPKEHGCTSQYILVNKERSRSINPFVYDEQFEKLINLYTPLPEVKYPSIDHVWTKFQNMFLTINDALCYLPAYRAYHWQMLEEMYKDNIMYAEVRLDFKELYDLSGRTFPPERTVRELLNIVEEFRRRHENFLGIKAIFATHRAAEVKRVMQKMDTFRKLHSLYPNFIVGFDLVGQEDKGKPLYNFIQSLVELPQTAKYFFHAGETNWYGASTDLNLIDAILMNTTRIGHGYALMKHPILWNAVKTRDIAVEVSPISNQVLHLVHDMRNHPGAFFISQNIPMVICNDDPSFWGAQGLSFDFYYVAMSFAPSNAGLKVLKSLVWNSIRYSTMDEIERNKAYLNLERSWKHFIDDVLQGFVF